MGGEYCESYLFRLTAVVDVYLFEQITLDELGTGLAAAISTALVNRLMISVKQHYRDEGHRHAAVEPPTDTTHLQSERIQLSTMMFDPTSVASTSRLSSMDASRGDGGEYAMHDLSREGRESAMRPTP